MKENDLMMVIRPEANETKLLMMKGRDQMMKAVLPPASRSHHRAASTLIEALALWYQQHLSVALYADVWAELFATGFCEVLGFGEVHLHHNVEVVDPRPRENERQLTFKSCLSDLEKVCTRRWL